VLGGSGQSTVIQADAPLPPVYYRIELVP
jgi:hypothetical protein